MSKQQIPRGSPHCLVMNMRKPPAFPCAFANRENEAHFVGDPRGGGYCLATFAAGTLLPFHAQKRFPFLISSRARVSGWRLKYEL